MSWNGLAERARLLFYLQAFSRLLFFWVPASVVTSVVLTFLLPLTWAVVAGIALFFAMFVTALWYPTLAFERWGWVVGDDELVIARGVWVRSITAIPMHRIQHVDTRQGPLEQWLGLARVQVHTASGVGGDGVVPGLLLADAEALRDRLVHRGGDSGV